MDTASRTVEGTEARKTDLKLIYWILGISILSETWEHGLNVHFEWTQLDFDYISDKARQDDIDNGNFIPGKIAPVDVDAYHSSIINESKVFVTIPRLLPGVPVTLGTLKDNQPKNPILTPFPDWSWHQNPEKCNSNRMVSVFRVMVDECHRLWVLDTGRLLNNLTCPPQILAFDLQTNKLIHKYEIPHSLLEPRSDLVTIVSDVRGKDNQCENTFVYVADCQAYSIIVYDVNARTSWKATDETMYPYPNYGTYNINGSTFQLMDGVVGMSLSPYAPGEDRKLFYHAMSSPTENWVYTSFLRNQSLFIDGPSSSPQIFHTYEGQRHTQSGGEVTDKDGIMYYGLLGDYKIACFNTKGEYESFQSTDIIAHDPLTIQFPGGMKVITNESGEQELWVITSRFQRAATGTLDSSETNFRIFSGNIAELTASKRCRS